MAMLKRQRLQPPNSEGSKGRPNFRKKENQPRDKSMRSHFRRTEGEWGKKKCVEQDSAGINPLLRGGTQVRKSKMGRGKQLAVAGGTQLGTWPSLFEIRLGKLAQRVEDKEGLAGTAIEKERENGHGKRGVKCLMVVKQAYGGPRDKETCRRW